MKAQTLREIATTQPGATGVFLEHGLDFCCGGRKSLADACAEKGLEPEAIMEEIESRSPGPEDLTRLAKKPLRDLVNFVEARYHAKLRADLPEVIALAEKVERVHEAKSSCPHGLADLLKQMQAAVLDHLSKEEQVLFPMIRAGFGNAMNGAIQCMEREHEDHGESLARLRDITNNFTPPAEACTTWRALYLRLTHLSDELMEHIHLENNVVFPRALCE